MDFSQYLSQLPVILPELGVLAAAVAAMFTHLFAKRNGRRAAGWVSLAGLLVALGLLINVNTNLGTVFAGSMVVDPFSLFLKILFLLSAALAIVLAFKFYDHEGYESGEVYYLVLFAVIGMMFTVSSVDLITFYVSFELFAIVSYILAGIFKKDIRSAEAGIKYFILGILSSAVMLMGMAFLYGASGSTTFEGIGNVLYHSDSQLIPLGMVLLFIGLFFKMALVPFHMWTPDVYEGTATPLVVFLSTAPKAAVLGVLMRMLDTTFPYQREKWSLLFTVVAIVTMFWGNIAALVQTNIKRMMAYSSIAHAGYLMIGLAAFGHLGNYAVLFYLFAYLFMNTAAFAMILLVQKKNGFGETITDLNGLVKRAPLMAGGIIVLLLSLTGIPPTAGFIGKYYLFAAAVEKGMYLLAVAGALNSVISLFYYFRIGRAMFMENQSGESTIDTSIYVKTVLLISFAVLLLVGIFPGALTTLVDAVSLVR